MHSFCIRRDNRVQGFLGPGHVCTVVGYREYEPIAARYQVPIVITGFEPIDLLEGMLMTVRLLEAGRREVENQYAAGASAATGTASRRNWSKQVFEVCDRKWRGVGSIPKSGYKLRYEYRDHDAERIFDVARDRNPGIADLHQRPGFTRDEEAARLPRVRQGMHAAASAGRDHGFAEGACAAYYAYGRHLETCESRSWCLGACGVQPGRSGQLQPCARPRREDPVVVSEDPSRCRRIKSTR